MKKTNHSNSLNLSWEEIGFICEGMSLASRPLRLATQNITDEYSLGPRGAWIVLLISTGQVFPLDLTNVFQVGRSLITAELTRLTEAGLITYRKSTSDGRRVELTLTALGKTINRRVKEGVSELILDRLSSYTREEILLCARMLRDFRVPEAGTEPWRALRNGSKGGEVKKKSISRSKQPPGSRAKKS